MPKHAKPAPVTGLKAVNKRLADGTVKTFFYDRATKLALGSDRAAAIRRIAEIQAMSGPELRVRKSGSIAALVAEFRQSPEYVVLADSTKALWRPFLTDLEERVGHWTPRMFTLPLASKFKATLIKKHGSGSARNRFKCYARLWNWGRANGSVESENPFERPGAFANSNAKPKTKPIWRAADVSAFLSASRARDFGGAPGRIVERPLAYEPIPDDIRMSFILGLFTLQRQADVLAMTADQITKDKSGRLWMRITQQKTGEMLRFPLLSLLADELARQGIEIGMPTPLVRTRSGGKFEKRNFGRKFSTWLEAARIDHLDYRALRRSGMVWLAEAGVNTPMIAALSGHSIAVTQGILDTYIVKTDRLAAGAVDAFERIVNSTASPFAEARALDCRR
jgi:integrase